VELHHGKVEALSEGADRGSEFVVRLPVLEKVPGLAPMKRNLRWRRPQAVRPGADVTTTWMRRKMAMLLRLAGHAVRPTYDGPAALEAARPTAGDRAARHRPAGMNATRWPGNCGSSAGGRGVVGGLTGYGQDEDGAGPGSRLDRH